MRTALHDGTGPDPDVASRIRTVGAGLNLVLKVAFVVLATTAVTWTAIREYWRELYSAGLIPYYYAGAMGLMRPVVSAPVHGIVLGVTAMFVRERLGRVPWLVLAVIPLVTLPIAGWVEGLGLACHDAGWPVSARLTWDVGPPAVSVVLLLVSLCAARSPKRD